MTHDTNTGLRIVLLLGAIGIIACDRGPDPELAKRLEHAEEQLTTARNDVMTLRKRVDALEAAAEPGDRVAVPLPPGHEVRLPTPSPGDDQGAFTLLRAGLSEMHINGEVVTEADLDARLEKHAKADPEGALIVHADEAVSYARVIHLLDRAKAAGFQSISLATQIDANPPPPPPEPTPPLE